VAYYGHTHGAVMVCRLPLYLGRRVVSEQRDERESSVRPVRQQNIMHGCPWSQPCSVRIVRIMYEPGCPV